MIRVINDKYLINKGNKLYCYYFVKDKENSLYEMYTDKVVARIKATTKNEVLENINKCLKFL